MTIIMRTDVDEDLQSSGFMNATMQGSGGFVFSIATFIDGLGPHPTQDDLATSLREVLDRMVEAAKPAQVIFEVEIGEE